MGDDTVTIRRARVGDARKILDLINRNAAKQIMLPRSPVSIIENIRDFVVAEVDGEFAGCGGLHVVWSDLAEIRSIAVREDIRTKGLGRRMVDVMVEEALELGISKLFAFTYVPGFFNKLGFHVVEHAELPHKVFADCMNCPKFQACDEIAMVRILRETTTDAPDQGPLSRPLPSFPLPRMQF